MVTYNELFIGFNSSGWKGHSRGITRDRRPSHFTERLQRPPSRPRLDTLPRQPRPILEIPRHPSNDQQRCRIQQHKVQHGPQLLRDLFSRGQQPRQRRRILRRPSARHRRERVRAEPKLRGMEDGLGDVPIGRERPCPRVPRTADLVEAFGATYHQRPCDAAIAQRLCKGQPEFALGDAEDHTTWTGGADERTNEVKERAKGERFAVGRDEGEGGVVERGEDEHEWDAGDGRGRSRRRSDEMTVERL